MSEYRRTFLDTDLEQMSAKLKRHIDKDMGKHELSAVVFSKLVRLWMDIADLRRENDMDLNRRPVP